MNPKQANVEETTKRMLDELKTNIEQMTKEGLTILNIPSIRGGRRKSQFLDDLNYAST